MTASLSSVIHMKQNPEWFCPVPAWSWTGKLRRFCSIMSCGDHAVWKHDHPPLCLSLSLTHVAYPCVTDLSLCPVNHWSPLFSHVWSFPLFAFELIALFALLAHTRTLPDRHAHAVHTLNVHSQALKYFLSDTHSSASLRIFFLPFFFTHSWCWHCFSTHAPYSDKHTEWWRGEKESKKSESKRKGQERVGQDSMGLL